MGGMIKCKNCGTIIHSVYRHDFQACKCIRPENACYVDGGFDYTRIGGHPENIELVEHKHLNKENLNEITIDNTVLCDLK